MLGGPGVLARNTGGKGMGTGAEGLGGFVLVGVTVCKDGKRNSDGTRCQH